MIEQWYIKQFNRLSSSRQVGMGVGGIPLSEILALREVLDEDWDFVDFMQACDEAFLECYKNDQTKTA